MNYLSQTILSEEFAPVLLGYSSLTDEIARRFFRRYRIISHVFCERAPLIRRISPVMKFHRFRHAVQHDELLLTALEDFADSIRNPDVVLCLIPTTKSDSRFMVLHRERLESRYVVAWPEEIKAILEHPEGVPNI